MYENSSDLRMMIFFADDDLDDQHFFRKAITRIDESIELITANNGEEAICKLLQNSQRPPDFIFLDMNMPRMTGLECLCEIKKHEYFRHIPVIMYSTSFQEKDILESKQLGALDFFRKPTSVTVLAYYLKSLLLGVSNSSL
jgi:CheY-like chemotaxis protein